jgi:hypothetical protein
MLLLPCEAEKLLADDELKDRPDEGPGVDIDDLLPEDCGTEALYEGLDGAEKLLPWLRAAGCTLFLPEAAG